MDADLITAMAPALAPTLEPLVSGGGDEIRAAMDRIAALGFRAAQLSATQAGMRPRDLDHSARRDLQATLRRRELSVAGLDAWIPPQHFLDPLQVDRAVSAMQQNIELAAALNRCPISFTLPGVAQKEGESDLLQHVIESLSSHADRFGVRLADHAVPIVDRGPIIGIGIDPAAWLASGNDPAAAILASGGRLVAARLCDLLTSGMRGPIGDPHHGRLDVLSYKAALDVSGYRQYVIVDARQWQSPWESLMQTLRTWSSSI